MRERPSAIIVAASLLLAWPAAAEKPATPAPQPASQPADQRPPAVLAAVDSAKLPAPKSDAAAVAPKKPRAARVTTCRCADVAQR